MGADTYGLKVLLLRAETLVGRSFENTLRRAGHAVTVISSPRAAFLLIDSVRPDMVAFDPISEFGFSESVQRLCSSFDGPIVATGLNADSPMADIVATGLNADSPMADRLRLLGVSLFAANASELLEIAQSIPVSEANARGASQPVQEPQTTQPVQEPQTTQPASQSTMTRARTADDRVDSKKSESGSASETRSLKRWHWATAGIVTAIVAAAVVAVGILLSGNTEDAPVAKALPVVPSILLKPLAPLTIEELSGDSLPLKISGIKDRTMIEAPAVAFWGNTAPDAFVTVNGEHVEVSEYGAFVVDYPLEDGANFIEILASDFQGRTTRVSFTLVRTQ